MPQRFLRPGLTTSRRFNRCDWFGQCFYTRLITLVDDHGRYEADLELLRSLAFPFGDPTGAQIHLQTIANSCQQLLSVGLVKFYEVDGKSYLQLLRWKERARSDSRYPEAPPEHLTTNDSKCLLPKPSPTVSSPQPSPTPSVTPSPEPPTPTVTLPATQSQTATAEAGNGTCVRVDLNSILPKKRVETTDSGAMGLISELNSLYLRPEGSAWSYEEEHLAADVANRKGWQAELKLLVWYRGKLPEKRYFPNTIRALLSGWTAHLDKARLATKHKSMRYE